MNASILTTIAITGFTIAFLHAAIPTHWLPFVLTGRVQKWSHGKTLAVTALAGSGHVLFTAALGFLVAWLGFKISENLGAWFPRIAGGALLLFGAFYIYRQLSGRGHGHMHLIGGHDHSDEHGHDHKSDHAHGAHGGPIVNTGQGGVELSVFETGVPPRFRLYFLDDRDQPVLPPAPTTVAVTTVRPDGTRQRFAFAASKDFIESIEEIPEPHAFNAVLELRHGDHTHSHEIPFIEDHHHDGHEHTDEPEAEPVAAAAKSDWGAIASLFVLLTFSPCEGFIPVYVSGVRYGWSGFALLTVILSVGTVLGMVVFTWLTLHGLKRLKLRWVEKYEAGVLGGLLCLLGVLVIIFEK